MTASITISTPKSNGLKNIAVAHVLSIKDFKLYLFVIKNSFTNISDKTINLSNEEIEKAKKLRNELRNYFDNKDVKRDLIYIDMGWSFKEEFYNKFKYLCEL